ncbi:MAG: hypothetical protein RIB45_09675 [Marivibrio sp.]|uniref:hypothetical protein n=1 Tax=Marivibrio sp. TaxID=2039719 RepID=UPI0032ECE0DF
MNKSPRRAAPPFLALLVAFALAACEQVGLEALSPGEHLFQTVDEDDPRAPPPTVMQFDLETLEGTSSLLSTRVNEDDAVFERRRIWRTADPTGVHASILIQSRTNGRVISYPGDVREAITLWPDLYLKNAAFAALIQSRNALGPVFYRRFEAGGQLCVLFQQGLGPNPNEVMRRVAGYYCAPVGDGLTAGQAETVIRAVRLVDRDE